MTSNGLCDHTRAMPRPVANIVRLRLCDAPHGSSNLRSYSGHAALRPRQELGPALVIQQMMSPASGFPACPWPSICAVQARVQRLQTLLYAYGLHPKLQLTAMRTSSHDTPPGPAMSRYTFWSLRTPGGRAPGYPRGTGDSGRPCGVHSLARKVYVAIFVARRPLITVSIASRSRSVIANIAKWPHLLSMTRSSLSGIRACSSS